ncbi:hypothetical protein SEA_KNOCKER_34 [Mycobacterium phage Knocker]|nr:hypothetical protein SEA_KNOCKER_34 [Mycobacterium phage Knocker]
MADMEPFDPSLYTWAVGYEFTMNVDDPDAPWQFVAQAAVDQQGAIDQYQQTIDGLAAQGMTPDDVVGMRNFGVYYIEPQTWHRFQPPPAISIVTTSPENPATDEAQPPVPPPGTPDQ